MTTPHLDDERLSAHLDGEGGEAAAEHLGSCRECTDRLDSLVLVSSCVGSSVTAPPEGVREAALQAARTAWAAARRESEGTGDGEDGEVVALEERRHVPRWALPVAAAAAALLLAVPVLSSLGDDRGGEETSALSDDRGASADRDAETVGTDGGDLGEQSDPATLARAISGALPGAASEAALATPAGPEGDGAAPSDDTRSANPQPVTAQSSAAAPEAKTRKLGERPCAGVVRTTYGQGLGPLVYTALVRWKGAGVDPALFPMGEPAIVLAYRLADPGAPGLDYRVMVMALEDCRLLVAPSL